VDQDTCKVAERLTGETMTRPIPMLLVVRSFMCLLQAVYSLEELDLSLSGSQIMADRDSGAKSNNSALDQSL
jgi:hypothetical protein